VGQWDGTIFRFKFYTRSSSGKRRNARQVWSSGHRRSNPEVGCIYPHLSRELTTSLTLGLAAKNVTLSALTAD